MSRVERGAADEPVRVVGTPGLDERFDIVVNALWHGRLEIDLTAGLVPDHVWSHRYRRCLFVRCAATVDVPSAMIAVGPFGDVKNYDGRNFYLSWYPVGLVAQSSEVSPPVPPPLDEDGTADFVARVRRGLETVLPDIGSILDTADEVTVAGGHVFARGTGSIGDPASELHRRDRYGTLRRDGYLSVDTGKYSTAPWAAERLARTIMERP